MKIRRPQSPILENGISAHIDGNIPAALGPISRVDTESLLSPPRYQFSKQFSQSGRPKLKIVILGPSLDTPGNGHAAINHGLLRELTLRGHDVLFLERGADTASPHRSPKPGYGQTEFYSDIKELKHRFAATVRDADFTIVGSPVSDGDGAAIGDWITHTARGATAFYDTDLPATMKGLLPGAADSISAEMIRRFSLYLSSTGGPLLDYMEKHYGLPMARPLYPSVDATLYFPEQRELDWDLGYAGGYSEERHILLHRLLLEPAQRWNEGHFVVAGPGYPRSMRWPKNVKRIPQLPAGKRRAFYNSLRFALNVTPPGEIAIGFSPDARLFEAAACGTPVISDFWPGLHMFFKPDEEILISHSSDETLVYLEEIPELDRRRMGYRARERVLAGHTTRHRAAELENYALEILKLATA